MTTVMAQSKAMAMADAQSCGVQPLPANLESAERCSKPFCDRGSMNAKQGKKFCCDHCRMDGYVLRRARAAESRIDAYGVMIAIGHDGDDGLRVRRRRRP